MPLDSNNNLFIPSYNAGFARSAAESDRSWFWDDLVLAWCPFLGVEKNSGLRDWSGFNWTTSTAWQSGVGFVTGGGPIHVNFPDTAIQSISGPQISSLQNNFTIVARIRQADHTKSQHICSIVIPNNCWQFFFDGGTDLELRRLIGSNKDASITLSTSYNDVWFSCAGRHSIKDGGAVFADGKVKGTNGTTGALTNTPTVIHFGSYGAGGEDLVGDIAALYLYNRPKSDLFITSLMEDWTGPMRLKRRIYKAPAAVGGLSIPVAMNSYRRRRVYA